MHIKFEFIVGLRHTGKGVPRPWGESQDPKPYGGTMGWDPGAGPLVGTIGWDPGVGPWGEMLGWDPGVGVWGGSRGWDSDVKHIIYPRVIQN